MTLADQHVDEVAGATESGPEACARSFEHLAESLAASRRSEPAALAELRAAALARFREEGLPHARLEEWRSTNPAPLVRTPYGLGDSEERLPERAAVESFFLDGCRNLVVVDGRLRPELSDDPGNELEIATLCEDADPCASWRLGQGTSAAEPHVNAFALLNLALFEHGVGVRAARSTTAIEPIHLIHVSRPQAGPRAVFPRTVLLAEENSELTVVESYVTLTGESLDPGVLLVCPVTEIDCGENARLRHYRIGAEDEGSYHVATQFARLARAARCASLAVSYGGAITRCDVNALLAGEGGDCILDGLYVLRGRQQFDTHMRVEHRAAHCDSHELYKGILDEDARAVFNGCIYVHPGAQKTDAKQTNRNLLLSDRAIVHSNPQLEIFADDVKCTHGSTIGQLEDEALFYLRSRGIPEDAAKSLLVYAFALEVLDDIEIGALRTRVEAALSKRLPGGEVVAEMTEAAAL